MTVTLRDTKGSELTHDELDANFTHFTDALTISGVNVIGLGTFTVTELLTASKDVFVTRQFSTGAAVKGQYANNMSAVFTSDGSDAKASGFHVGVTLTGANGDTTSLSQVLIESAISTQDNSETITDVASLILNEPGITKGASDTITNASTFKITGAPTEGSNNYAFWVDDGAVRVDVATQATVGAAGGASALPATPTGYLELDIGGTAFVVPYYAKS